MARVVRAGGRGSGRARGSVRQGPAGDGLVEVVGAAQSGGGAGAGLVQEAGFGEGSERGAYLGEVGVFGVQCGGEL